MPLHVFLLRLIAIAATHRWAPDCGTTRCPVCAGRGQVIDAIHSLGGT